MSREEFEKLYGQQIDPRPGFYMGKEAFALVRLETKPMSPNITELNYKGYQIILDRLLPSTQVVGVGEPYASLAKKMGEQFGNL